MSRVEGQHFSAELSSAVGFEPQRKAKWSVSYLKYGLQNFVWVLVWRALAAWYEVASHVIPNAANSCGAAATFLPSMSQGKTMSAWRISPQ